MPSVSGPNHGLRPSSSRCSVTVDLAAEQGGNIETTVPGQVGCLVHMGNHHGWLNASS